MEKVIGNRYLRKLILLSLTSKVTHFVGVNELKGNIVFSHLVVQSSRVLSKFHTGKGLS